MKSNNQTQHTTPTSNDRRDDIDTANNGVIEYQESILALVSDYMGTTSAIPALNEMVVLWLRQRHVDQKAMKNGLEEVLGLITFLDKLRGYNEALEVNSSWLARLEKESTCEN